MLSLIDIIQSIRVPVLIKDGFIRTGKPCLDSRNRPIHYVGGFAVVFPFEVNGCTWAFRCWSADLGNVEKRLQTLSSELSILNLPYFCQFYYEPEGIVVNGKTYPTTRMKWIDGIDIKEYIYQNREDSRKLNNLAQTFLSMCKDLHANKIAHGDLQHGNILIDKNEEVYLIDYDSVYVPQLKGESDIIAGLADYQHPKRSQNQYASEKLDYFSELIIYFSILLIASNPSLADKYNIEDADRLLFSKEDFLDLKASEIYSDILSKGKEFELLLLILQEYLSVDDINLLEPFDVLLERYKKDPEIRSFAMEQSSGVYKGSKAKLCWKVENASKIILDGTEVNRDSRSVLVDISNTKDFLLEVVNGQKSVKSVCRVTVLQEPNISLKASTPKVRKGIGEAVTIKWKVDNAVCVELIADGIVLSENKSGELLVYPKETTTYRIIAVGLDRKKSFKKECKVVALSVCEAVFESNKNFSYPGLPIVLSWNVKHAKSVELVGFGKQSNKGSIVDEPQYDKVYELLVDDAFGQKSFRTTVRMLPLPLVKSLVVPCPDSKTKINIQLVSKVIDFKVSMPKLPEISINQPKIQIAPELQTTIGKKIEVCSKTELVKKDKHPIISKIRDFVHYNILKLSIWEIKVLKSSKKNSND